MTDRALASLLLLGALAACGEAGDVASDLPSDARTVLDCTAGVHDHGSGNYDTGPETLSRDAARALAGWVEESAAAPWVQGLALVSPADGRATATAEADGRVVAAAVLEDGLSGQGRDGWGVTSWAVCDPADFPESVSAAAGVQVWEDAQGRRVAVDRVVSYAGPEHCDWQRLTFLTVGDDTYLGGPAGDLGRALDGRWDPSTALPGNVTRTGFEREGRRLWLAADGSAAYVGASAAEVERWPAETEPIGCA